MRVVINKTLPILRAPAETGVFIQWTIEQPPSDQNITFKLERSGSPEGPFEHILDNIKTFHFFDDLRGSPAAPPVSYRENVNFLSLSRGITYRVTATANNVSTSDTYTVGYTIANRKLALLRRKMQRDLALSLKFNGVDTAIIKKKHWGTRCNTCFDQLTKRVTNSKCAVCYGTGFDEGYFTPIKVRARFTVENMQSNLTQQGIADTNQIHVYLLSYPVIETQDLVVNLTSNQRYIVKQRRITSLQTEPVHQTLVISELANDAIEYRIPANQEHAPSIY